MNTENQEIKSEETNIFKRPMNSKNESMAKKAKMKSLSLKPGRSIKKSNSIKSVPLKLK
jgi:hypothetical protein